MADGQTTYGTGANQFSFYRPTTAQALNQSTNGYLGKFGNFLFNTAANLNPLYAAYQTQASNVNLEQQQRLQAEQQKAFSDELIRQKTAANMAAKNKTTPPPTTQKQTTTGGGGGTADASKQYGGWYWRPELGKAMRWFNGTWTDGEEPGGNPTASDIASLAPTMGAVPEFNFDWTKSEAEALEKLTPYYEEIIAEAKGDMDLAIKRLTEDYDTGVRYANENWKVLTDKVQQDYFLADRMRQENLLTNTGRTMEDMYREKRIAEEDAATQTKEAARLEPQERAATNETLNKRGVLESSIATNENTDLSARQAARREAINTALARKQEVSNLNAARGTSDLNTDFARQVEQADIDKLRTLQEADITKARAIEKETTPYQRAVEDYQIQLPRFLRDINQEKVGKAEEMANMDYQRNLGNYLAEMGQYSAGYQQ